MIQTIFSPMARFILDFSKKKVVEHKGDYRGCMDKYSLAYWLDAVSYRVFTGSRMDLYKYSELKEMLLQELEAANYENVIIIK